MIRTANGTDPNIIDEGGQPDACGLVFDDVERMVTHPHVFIPTREEKDRMLAQMEEILVEQYPELAPRA